MKKINSMISLAETENAEPEKNYEEEIVINAIAQLATANGRIGRVFTNQKTERRTRRQTCMIHTHADWYAPLQTNNCHFNSTLTANQIKHR